MAVSRVLDTNVVLYLLGGRLAAPLDKAISYISVVTELELLSYPSITPEEDTRIRAFLEDLVVVDLNPEVRHSAIYLRRAYALKLPDAIICATALTLNATLLTNDKKLANVAEISVSPVALRSA